MEELDAVLAKLPKFDIELGDCPVDRDATEDAACLFAGSRDGKALIFKSGVIVREGMPTCPIDD